VSDAPKFLYVGEPEDRAAIEFGRQAVVNAMNAARTPVILTAELKRLVLLAELGVEAKRFKNAFRLENEG
jgi:hypothetical protein